MTERYMSNEEIEAYVSANWASRDPYGPSERTLAVAAEYDRIFRVDGWNECRAKDDEFMDPYPPSILALNQGPRRERSGP